MINKYKFIFEKVHEYIFNRIQLVEDDLVLAREVFGKFPVYVAFFKVDTEMQIEMLEQIIAGSRLTRRILEDNYNAKRDKEKIKNTKEGKDE